MTVVPLPLSPKQEFRALFDFVLLDDAIIDTAGLWTPEGLLACDADAADPQEEIDGSATVLDFVPPKRINSGGGSHASQEPQEAA
jgi:hypothetical protein